MGLDMVKNFRFCIRLANQSKVKCLGIIKNIEVEVFDAKNIINCYVMLEGIGSLHIILRRPCLQATRVIQD